MADFLDEKRHEIDARLRELRPLVDEYNRLEKAAAALVIYLMALELVRARPGITIRELAEAMGIHANYLYRVMPTLESEGQVVKRDRGWHPA